MKWLMVALAVVLTVDPANFTVIFSPSPANDGIAITVESNTNSQHYFSSSYYPILEDDQDSIVIPRYVRLPPRNSYVIRAYVMQLDENGQSYPVESSPSVVIHVP